MTATVDNTTLDYFLDHFTVPGENYTAIFEAAYASDMTSLSFSSSYAYQRLLVITVGSVAGAGVLAIVLFWFFMALRCCVPSLRCLPRAPTDEEIELYNVPLDFYEEDEDDAEDDGDGPVAGERKVDEADEEAGSAAPPAGRRRSVRHYRYQHPSQQPQPAAGDNDDDNMSRYSRHSRHSLGSGSGSGSGHLPRRGPRGRSAAKPSRPLPPPPPPPTNDGGLQQLTAANTTLNAQLTRDASGTSHVTDATGDGDGNGDDDDDGASAASQSSYAWSEESWRDVTKRLFPYTPRRRALLGAALTAALLALGCCVFVFLGARSLVRGVRGVEDAGDALMARVRLVANSSDALTAYGVALNGSVVALQRRVANASATLAASPAAAAALDPLCVALANDTRGTTTRLFASIDSALRSFDAAVGEVDDAVAPLFGADGDALWTRYAHGDAAFYFADGAALFGVFGVAVAALLGAALALVTQRRRAAQASWALLTAAYAALWLVATAAFAVTLPLGDLCAGDSPADGPTVRLLRDVLVPLARRVAPSHAAQLAHNVAFYATCAADYAGYSSVNAALGAAQTLVATTRASFDDVVSANGGAGGGSGGSGDCGALVAAANATLAAVAHETDAVLPQAVACEALRSLWQQLTQDAVCGDALRGAFRLWGAASLAMALVVGVLVASALESQYARAWDSLRPPYDGDDDADGDGDGDAEAGDAATKKPPRRPRGGLRVTTDDDDALSLDDDDEIEIDAQGRVWVISPSGSAAGDDGAAPQRRPYSFREARSPVAGAGADAADGIAATPAARRQGSGGLRRESSGSSGPRGGRARPASLRSILTVEYWTRPLPPTPPAGPGARPPASGASRGAGPSPPTARRRPTARGRLARDTDSVTSSLSGASSLPSSPSPSPPRQPRRPSRAAPHASTAAAAHGGQLHAHGGHYAPHYAPHQPPYGAQHPPRRRGTGSSAAGGHRHAPHGHAPQLQRHHAHHVAQSAPFYGAGGGGAAFYAPQPTVGGPGGLGGAPTTPPGYVYYGGGGGGAPGAASTALLPGGGGLAYF